MKDPKLVRAKIAETLDLMEIMLAYDVDFKFDPRYSDETQFKCAFHGSDNKPSARLYKETNTCYCWVCKKRWDSFSFIMEKEGLMFSDAVRFIVNRFKLDISDIPDGPALGFNKDKKSSDNTIVFTYLKNKIVDLQRKIELNRYKSLVFALNMLLFAQHKGENISTGLNKLKLKIDGIKL